MSIGAGGLLLVQRFGSDRTPSGGRSAADVLRRYRGFEGIAWPGNVLEDIELISGLAPPSEIERLLPYYEKIDSPDVDLIYCSAGEDPQIPGFEFVGFDAGYYQSEYLHYSVLFNEVLYGSVPHLTELVTVLNAHLLFSTEPAARELINRRQALSGSDAELERGEEELLAIPIFAPRRPEEPACFKNG